MFQDGNANGKYNISQMMYPSDLMDPIYGGNMALFFINVATASKFLPNNNETIGLNQLDTPRLRGITIGRNVDNLNAVVSGVLGNGLAGLVVGSFAGVGSLVGAGGAISAAALYAATDIAGTTTREQKRLKSAIALHMPNGLSIRYSADWATDDMAQAEMVSRLGEATVKSLSEMSMSSLSKPPTIDSLKSTAKDIYNSGAGAAAANLGLANAPGGSYISARTGLAANPRKEMVFKGVDFRTFSFEYKFYPRSDEEAKNIEQIINTFKFHMHPEYKDADSFLYLYPSEFDIVYYTNYGENQHIHKHTSCVLTEMSVSYGAQGNFTVFANGMPTEINITLAFKELTIPTKETIKDPTLGVRGL